ncbi:Protein of unknown function [Saccharicrinis carchari]|uniref:Lamin Tail Domain n=1 Tax=Saccharicrinis carchari TaxID=1168039 RepID=A0A521EPA3_SACCC|nr:DUF4876 domain-containing protein [Saccharicrinis carchari]SMO85759.1 Protein of unknown function [Saccharicrinis carchari]
MRYSVLFTCVIVLLAGCAKEPIINSYSFRVSLIMPQGVLLDTYEGIELELLNMEKSYTVKALTDDEANAHWQGLEAGYYQMSVVHQVVVDNRVQTMNGIGSVKLTGDAVDTLQLFMGKAGQFVIREFYYSGSVTPSGDNSYSSDQYVEIYNNTDKLLYADGLSIVEHESMATSQNYWAYMAEDSIVVKAIWTVPGSGKEYPVLPGSGFIVARDAFDHRSDPNGNPLSPVDLGDAQFEFWSDATVDGDIDFAAINMIESFWVYKGKDVSFHSRGGSGIALVRLPSDIDTYVLNNLVPKGSSSRSRYFCKIPNAWVEDAVEAMWSNRLYKRFHPSLDAGYVSVQGGSKSGLGIRRKIKEKINGRTVYMDTNNSSVDFNHDVVPAPGNYDL